ncbi:MAG: two-component system response regulator [Rhizobiales bacterium PAR1]|nr:MAG: two-component system response regulator [Rhizobiales bacterium PAR1]
MPDQRPSDSQALSILVIDEDEIRASIIREGLREAGHQRVHVISVMDGLVRAVEDLAPDVIVIDLANPSRDLVEHLSQVSRAVRRPVAMFVDQSDAGIMEAAISAGVSAYVVDGLRKDRVKAILDMAVARFTAYSRLRDELESTRQALEDRKAIDRAKAILQKLRGVSEEEAYHLIRRKAMAENRRMGEVARALVSTADLLTGTDP